MLKSLLVPLDGSPLAEQALGPAIDLAKRAGAALHLVRVHHLAPAMVVPEAVVDWSALESSVREAETAYLDGVAERVRAQWDLSVDAAVTAGLGVGEICHHAEKVGADLVVMATHARTGIGRALFGSVADVVVRRGGVPVLLLKARRHGEAAAADVRFRRIVVALDGSASAEAILPAAADLAEPFGARCVLTQFVERTVTEMAPGLPLATMARFDREAFEREAERARIYLGCAAAKLRASRPGLRVETEVVTDGAPAVAIIQAAREGGAGLIALATHGRGASRLVVGSFADAVLRESPCDVLMVGPAHG